MYKGRAPFQSAAFTETQRNFTYFDKSLTSGLTDVMIESPGDFLYIDQASTGVIRVELNMRQGGSLAPITLAAGGSIECDFSSVKLTADAQLNKSVRIIIGNGARIKGGANVNASSMSVSVVDGGKARTENNQAFIGYTECAAVADNYSHVQLFNPVNSGKNIILEKCVISSPTAQSILVKKSTVVIATLHSPQPISKKLGGSASSAVTYYETSVAAVGSTAFFLVNISANLSFDMELREPVVMAPGYGIVISAGTVNTTLRASFEYYQE